MGGGGDDDDEEKVRWRLLVVWREGLRRLKDWSNKNLLVGRRNVRGCGGEVGEPSPQLSETSEFQSLIEESGNQSKSTPARSAEECVTPERNGEKAMEDGGA